MNFPLHRYRYAFAALVFALAVSFKLHGSSIGVWDVLISEKTPGSGTGILLGSANGIRSDEWLIQTPLYLSQGRVNPPFPVVNPAIRSSGQNMLLSLFAPVADWVTLARPFNWGFLWMSQERGLSWYWFSKLLLLLLCSYEFCLILTSGDRRVSALGAAWIGCSSFVQWSFSTGFVELILFFQAAVVCFWRFFDPCALPKRALLTVIFSLSVAGFALSIQPAMQVPLVYLAIILALVRLFGASPCRRLDRLDFVLGIFASAITGFLVHRFVILSWDAIEIAKNTVYPGLRFSTGGDFDPWLLHLSSIAWLLPWRVPEFLNQTEASSFISMFPASLLIFICTAGHRDRNRALFLALTVYALFLIAWLLLPFPTSFAKWSLFSFVPGVRLHFVVDLITCYLSIWAVSKTFTLPQPTVSLRTATVFCVFLAVILLVALRNSPMWHYLRQPGWHLLALSVYFGLNWSLILVRRRLLVGLLVAYLVVSGVMVNPLAQGLSPIYGKTVTAGLEPIIAKASNARWVSVGAAWPALLLNSLGARTLTGFHWYPDIKLWQMLDPTLQYAHYWNRYAIVTGEISNSLNTSFRLQHENHFTAVFSWNDLKKLGVTHLLSVRSIKHNNARLLRSFEKDNLYVYELHWQ